MENYIEVADIPTTNDALKFLMEQPGMIVAPSKAVNAGSVATSTLEMTQDREWLVWIAKEIDKQFKQIMNTISMTGLNRLSLCSAHLALLQITLHMRTNFFAM